MNFYNLNQNTVSDYDFNPDKSNNVIYEPFTSNFIPKTSSGASDDIFQCSDNYSITGKTLSFDKSKNPIQSIDDCKTACLSDRKCIGFNYDNDKNQCVLKQNAKKMSDKSDTNTLCVKKMAGVKKSCKIKKGSDTQDNDSSENNSSQDSNLPIKTLPTPFIPSTPSTPSTPSGYILDIPKPEIISNIPLPVQQEIKTENKSTCSQNPNTIYVDLNCFMSNIKVLQNRSDNMMIDLSLLMSNVKSCSYIKKPDSKYPADLNIYKQEQEELATIPTENMVNKIISNVQIPTPQTVSLGITEPFETKHTNTNTFDDGIKILIIVIILLLILFNRK